MSLLLIDLGCIKMRPKNVREKHEARRAFLTHASAPEGRSANEVSAESIWAFAEKGASVTVNDLSILQKIIFMGIPILFAITVHEVSHGWMALRCGDRTAKVMGRLTLNPIKHVDLIGTIILPGLLILMQAPFIFGWAKPVPVDWRNLRNPKRDMAWVALMGPFSNFMMALFWAFLLRFMLSASAASYWLVMAKTGIMINTALMVLNLLPLPPLDGSRILRSFLSPRAAYQYNKLERYGFVILMILLLTHVLSAILLPLFTLVLNLISSIAGLN